MIRRDDIETIYNNIREILTDSNTLNIPNLPALNSLYQNIYQIIQQAQKDAYQTFNVVMLQAYWSIGKLIAEEEQKQNIDLKIGELNHQDIGQMDMYVRLYEDKIRQESDSPTIGIILCNRKDATVVKYSMLEDSEHLFASKYQLYIPSKEELAQEVEQEIEQYDIRKRLKE